MWGLFCFCWTVGENLQIADNHGELVLRINQVGGERFLRLVIN